MLGRRHYKGKTDVFSMALALCPLTLEDKGNLFQKLISYNTCSNIFLEDFLNNLQDNNLEIEKNLIKKMLEEDPEIRISAKGSLDILS
jgi:serine/threonine protein kinase